MPGSRHRSATVLILAGALSGWLTGTAASLTLDMPIECPSNMSCIIQKYVDTKPGPGYRDYTCGRLSSPDHKGTDFRVPTLADMAVGVPVVAAASGVVAATRDGMDDINVNELEPAAVAGRGGGNMVVIEHSDGWRTYYAHLRKGSILVAKGDRVVVGQQLGLIGMSGRAEFPHVEFGVRRGSIVIDPFLGPAPARSCGATDAPLWSASAAENLKYVATGLLSAGFAAEPATSRRARAGDYAAAELPGDSPVLVFWVDLFGVAKDDRATLRLHGPNGVLLVDDTRVLDKAYAQWFRFVGKRLRAPTWPPGSYRGELILRRPGHAEPIVTIDRMITISEASF